MSDFQRITTTSGPFNELPRYCTGLFRGAPRSRPVVHIRSSGLACRFRPSRAAWQYPLSELANAPPVSGDLQLSISATSTLWSDRKEQGVMTLTLAAMAIAVGDQSSDDEGKNLLNVIRPLLTPTRTAWLDNMMSVPLITHAPA